MEAWLLLCLMILYWEFIFDQSLFMGNPENLGSSKKDLFFLSITYNSMLLICVRASFMARYYQRRLYFPYRI